MLRSLVLSTLLLALSAPVLAEQCPPLLQGELPKLRSQERIDLCGQFAGKPLLVVNTASFCGFTPQFKGLEALYQRYKGQGLEVLAINAGNAKVTLEGRATREPTYGLSAIWISPEQRQQARTAGYTLVEPDVVLMTHLSEMARRYAPDFLTRAETEKLVEHKRASMGSLVDELVPQVLSYSDIQRVLQLLLPELPLAWVEFKVGQMGIFVAEREDLVAHHARIKALADARRS